MLQTSIKEPLGALYQHTFSEAGDKTPVFFMLLDRVKSL